MKTCPVCDTPFTDEKSHCPTDGAALIRSQELEAGRTVRSKYRIMKKIGQGGMGQVYLAEHLMLGGKLALKFLSPELSQSPRFIKRFRLEAKAAYQLKNPNIVEVVDLDQDEDGTLFIAMEYVEGASLRSVMGRFPSGLPPVQALKFAREVASGLAVAHGRGIIHRDIKPENILIAHKQGEADHAKVLDFGIAAMSEGITDVSRTHGVLLTPEYASPEQWRGTPANELDCRADLYALGGVLYEMLAGARPYKATNSEGWMFQHLNGNYTPLAALCPEIESEFRGIGQVVDQLLARDREDRLPCAEALVEELDRILEESPTAAREEAGPGATLFEGVGSDAGYPSRKSGGVRSGSRGTSASGDYSRQRTSGPQRTTGQQTASGSRRSSGEWTSSRPDARISQPVEAAPQARRQTGRIVLGAGILLALVGGGFAFLRLRPLPAAEVPVLSPAPGAYTYALQVTIADVAPGAVIHFTTDGSDPTESSQIYGGAIPVNSGEVRLRAIAVSAGHSKSGEAEGIYLVSPGAQGGTAPKPSPSLPVQQGPARPQTATGNSPAAGPQTATLTQTPAKQPQDPSLDRSRHETPTEPVKPPVQLPQQSTNPVRPRPAPEALGMQEISSFAADGMILSRTPPVYPRTAEASGVSGAVVLNIVISPSGNVDKVEAVSGPTELRQAAVDAVRNWRYRPYIIDGQALPVSTSVKVTFNLR